MERKTSSKSHSKSQAGAVLPPPAVTKRARRKPPKTPAPFKLMHPDAAGIDIGSASHFVAVPPDRDADPVREFKSFTDDLERLADWLTSCGIETVAMESTGVYWIALFELLERRGFTVLLINARHVKSVTGRKSRAARVGPQE